MASEEIGAYVLLAAYGLMVVGAVKVFGLKRVLFIVLGVVFLAIAIALKTLGGITSARRH